MNCRNHPTRAAVNTCSQCGDWLCEECTADVGGRIYCASCLQKYWAYDQPAAPKSPPPAYHPVYAEHPKRVSFGLLLFFTICMPPGVNYMFEGLIKRGLFILSSFFLSIYFASVMNEPIFGFITAIMWITCAFDAFNIRRRLNAGEKVPDSVDDLLGFIKKYKTAIIIVFMAIIGLHFVGLVGGTIRSALYSMPYVNKHIVYSMFSAKWVLPILILLGGVFFIVFSGKRGGTHLPKDDDKHDNIDN